MRRVVFAACGTSWHAALVGEYLIERLAHLPVEVEYASEFRYRNAPLDDRTLVFVLSQSGETADTLGALREAKRQGIRRLAIVNTVGSTIAREADGGIYLHAGPEVGVASTKAFTAQVTVLTLLALYLGRLRHLSYTDGLAVSMRWKQVPDAIGRVLATEPAIIAMPPSAWPRREVRLFLGRDFIIPVALEGALKLKEISYIHAEGYPTAEMKHGPIALIDRENAHRLRRPRGFATREDPEQHRGSQAPAAAVIAVGHRGGRTLIAACADVFVPIPDVPEVVQPLVAVVPLQLLAYHVARAPRLRHR